MEAGSKELLLPPKEFWEPIGKAIGEAIHDNALLVICAIVIVVALIIGTKRYVEYRLGVRKIEGDSERDKTFQRFLETINNAFVGGNAPKVRNNRKKRKP